MPKTKKIAIFIFVCVFLMGCSLPFTITLNTPDTPAVESQPVQTTEAPVAAATEAPAEAPTVSPIVGTEFNLGGVYMVVPACLASNATGTLIEAVPYDEMNGPMEYYPENRKVTFQGYPLSDKFFKVDDTENNGGLTIYPVADFVAMNSEVLNPRVATLQNLIATQPAVPESIPLLPIFNAASVFKAQVKYLSFQNGQGVRYLTEYAQYYAPVNNHDLFYSFQGLTSDGKYWISGIFPINATYLQESWDSTSVPAGGIAAPSYDDANLDASMQTYYSNMTGLLNATADGDFTPSLECLDQFIQSIHVGD